jgi:transposase
MSLLDICLAASSKEITDFQVMKRLMNYLHKMPKDFSFLQVPPFFEFLPIVISSSKEFSK